MNGKGGSILLKGWVYIYWMTDNRNRNDTENIDIETDNSCRELL